MKIKTLLLASMIPFGMLNSQNVSFNELKNRCLSEFQKQNYSLSINTCDQAIKIDPADVDLYIFRGMSKHELKDYNNAISDYDYALKIKPQIPNLYYEKGLSFEKLEKIDDALANYNKALKLDSKFKPALSGRASIYYSKENYKMALTDYSYLVQLDPASIDYLYNRAMTNFLLKNIEQGCKDIFKVKKMGDSGTGMIIEDHCFSDGSPLKIDFKGVDFSPKFPISIRSDLYIRLPKSWNRTFNIVKKGSSEKEVNYPTNFAPEGYKTFAPHLFIDIIPEANASFRKVIEADGWQSKNMITLPDEIIKNYSSTNFELYMSKKNFSAFTLYGYHYLQPEKITVKLTVDVITTEIFNEIEYESLLRHIIIIAKSLHYNK